jgi:hypothetical protein
MSAVIVLGAVLLAAMLAVPASVSADAPTPKWINGFVMDVMGRHLPNADVSITIDTTTHSEQADSDGFYSLQFQTTEWTIGSVIHIVATYNSQQATNESATASAAIVQWMNVTYPYEIPQFGSPLGLLLAGGFVAAVSIVLLTDKKRK